MVYSYFFLNIFKPPCIFGGYFSVIYILVGLWIKEFIFFPAGWIINYISGNIMICSFISDNVFMVIPLPNRMNAGISPKPFCHPNFKSLYD